MSEADKKADLAKQRERYAELKAMAEAGDPVAKQRFEERKMTHGGWKRRQSDQQKAQRHSVTAESGHNVFNPFLATVSDMGARGEQNLRDTEIASVIKWEPGLRYDDIHARSHDRAVEEMLPYKVRKFTHNVERYLNYGNDGSSSPYPGMVNVTSGSSNSGQSVSPMFHEHATSTNASNIAQAEGPPHALASAAVAESAETQHTAENAGFQSEGEVKDNPAVEVPKDGSTVLD